MNTVLRILGVLQDGTDLADATPACAAQPLAMVRGESVLFSLRVVGRNGVTVDLAGQTVTLVCAHSTLSVGDGFTLTAAVLLPASAGLAMFTLPSNTTRSLVPGRYVYSVWLNDAQNARVCVVPLSTLTLAASTFPSA